MEKIIETLYNKEVELMSMEEDEKVSEGKILEDELYDKVKEALSKEHFALVDELLSVIDDNNWEDEKDMYKRGFKAGVLLVTELREIQ